MKHKGVPPEVLEEVLERDGYHCQGCGTTRFLDPPHHIIFRSQGGKHVKENLVLLCRRCHTLAHTTRVQRKKWEEWAKIKYGEVEINGQ